MKCGRKEISLANQNWEAFAPGEDLHSAASGDETRSANEHHFQWSAGQGSRLGENCRVDLAPVGIAFYHGVEGFQTALLRMTDLAGQQDGTRTGAEHRPPGRKLLERLEEAPAFEELQHRGRLAAGEDQTVEGMSVKAEVFGILYQRRNCAGFDQCFRMPGVIALDGEHTDAGSFSVSQIFSS